MSPEPVHNQLLQAIQRDAELLNQAEALRTQLRGAKEAEDVLRKDPRFSEVSASLKAACDKTIAEAQAAFDRAAAVANEPFQAAKARFEAAMAEAQADLGRLRGDAEVEYKEQLAAETRTHDLAVAEARAAVHQAQRELAAHGTTVDQYRRNIAERLGVDLSKLLP